MKNAFFWCIICWCRSKIANFWNFAHFLAIFSIFSIFAFFLWFVEKKFWKRLKSVGNDPNLCENMIFDLFVVPEPRKMGGPQGPPPAPGKASPTSPLLGLRKSAKDPAASKNGNLISKIKDSCKEIGVWSHQRIVAINYLILVISKLDPKFICKSWSIGPAFISKNCSFFRISWLKKRMCGRLFPTVLVQSWSY